MRTLAFIAETCVFAYLGLALFSFRHRVIIVYQLFDAVIEKKNKRMYTLLRFSLTRLNQL